MRKFFFGFALLFFLGALGLYFGLQKNVIHIPAQAEEPFSLAAPLPSLLAKTFYSATSQSGYWNPHIEVASAQESKLDLSAASALSYDLTTDKVLYAKDIKKRLPIASLTKIMTAIVALENESPDDVIPIDSQTANVGEDSMGLSEGEKISVHDLLYGLFLHSGNDAAEALATGSKFGRDYFVYQMNQKAEDLGLFDTHFTNPTGLEGDGDQYSTAYDLLVMNKYGMAIPEFAETASTYEYHIPNTSDHKAYDLYNETNLLTSYPGVKGIKTGFTDEAGMCLATYLDYGGHKIIAVLLDSENRRQEMKDLLDYSLKSQGVKPPQHG